jgi:chemotaxis protein MotB
MTEDKEEKRPIVIRKIRKVPGSRRSAGWKPAPTHFAAALIPFFLLAWLLATAPPSARQAVVDYFRHHQQASGPGDESQR